jgi:hypothetical protein
VTESAKPDGPADGDLVEVMFAGDRVEGEMVQSLLESEGIPSMLQATGVNGPQLGVGLSPRSPQRVMVRAEHADLARGLLDQVTPEEELNVSDLANAGYMDESRGKGPRNYGVIGAYARIWFWSFVAFAVAVGIFLLARVT